MWPLRNLVGKCGFANVSFMFNSESKEEVNLFWVDTYVSDEQVRRLKPYQKVNHFPASFELGRKNHLCSNLNKMKRFFPREYNYFP